jgi:3-dehydroshikimate dehydratase
MIRIGLSSSALLTRSAKDVIAAAKASGIDAIEWAGDLHVAHDDLAAVQSAMMDTLRAGLTTVSYAPLYRVSAESEAGLRFGAVLRAAAILQAPFVRIYIGGPGRRDLAQVDKLAAAARRLGDMAARQGLTLCLSFGKGTGMDSYASAGELLAAIAHPFVRLAWEPLQGVSPGDATLALERSSPALGMILAKRPGGGATAEGFADEAGEWRLRLAALRASATAAGTGQFALIGTASDVEGPAGLLPGLARDAAFFRGLGAELEGKTV